MYRKYIKYLITLIVSVLAIIFGNTVQKTSLLAENNTEYAKTIVKQLVEDNPGGSQRVILSVKSGKYTVMDVAMSVSSTVNEIHSKNKELTQTELFKSGINVGRDMIGTMSNTLILAFIGNSINTLLVIYSYSLPYLQVVNMYAIGIEILRGISGTMGVILTVPFVSYISARMLKTN